MGHAGRLNTTKVAIDVALALKMGWLIQKENLDYTLGPNVQWEYIQRDINKPWLRDIEKGIPNFQLKRDWADLPDERGVNAFWRVTQNKVLRLSMSLHWRFIHLNQAFRSVIGSPMRTLHVYSDIGGSSIVGGQVTDLLREVQVQTTRARHRLLRTVTHPVPAAPQYLRGSDRKPNRRNQRSAGAVRRSHTHHPHLAFQTGPIKRTRGFPPSLRSMSLRRYTPPGQTGRGLRGVLMSTGQEIVQDGLNESLNALGGYDQVVRRTTEAFKKAAKRTLKRKAGEALTTSKRKVRDLFG